MSVYFGSPLKTNVILQIRLRNALLKSGTVYTVTNCQQVPLDFTGSKVDLNIWDKDTLLLNISTYTGSVYMTINSQGQFVINVPVGVINSVFKKSANYYCEWIFTDSNNNPITWWTGQAQIRDKI